MNDMGPASFIDSNLLLCHIAKCTGFYPSMALLPADTLLQYLLDAPLIAQEVAFRWEMLYEPAMGTVMLVWTLGDFPSDGYLWDGEEDIQVATIRDQVVEIASYHCGTSPVTVRDHSDQLAGFSRRRFRLKNQPGLQQHLWLVHYTHAEPQSRVLISNLRITPRNHSLTQTRDSVRQLYETRQLLQTPDFKLYERNTWPMLSIPGQHLQQGPPQMQQPGLMHHPQTPQQNRHISPMNARTTPQPPHHQIQGPGGPHPHPQAAYYTPGRPSPMAPGPAPPSAKRYKPSPAPHPNAAAAASQAAAMNAVGGDPAMTIEEEEDTSRGDILDHLTPREIAQTRYTQHHEWMEEVIGSAYPINRIQPVDLGLGLPGELESVTKGLVDPPIYPVPKPRINDPVEPEKKDQKEVLAEMKVRATNKIHEMEEEMRVMSEKHAARMAKIKATSIFKDAEADLRGGLSLESFLPGLHNPRPTDGDEGPEEVAVAREPATPAGPVRPIEEIVQEVEATAGVRIVPAQPVVRYELPAEEIIKMGGVVAQDVLGRRHNMDTVMDDDQIGTLDDDATFKLDIPTPPTDSPMPEASITTSVPDNTAGGLLDEFQAAQEESVEEMMEDDTIMADFMNVDDISKPTTPHHLQHHGDAMTLAGDAAGGSVGVASSTGEELFTIPPMEGATPGSGIDGLDMGIGA